MHRVWQISFHSLFNDRIAGRNVHGPVPYSVYSYFNDYQYGVQSTDG
jgi:hypothetical protein